MEEQTTDAWVSPSVADVIEVKEFFLEHSPLPTELIDTIIDIAEYWPHTTSIMVPREGTQGPFVVRTGDRHENCFLLRTPPLGYVAADNWKCSPSKRTITDVGPELEGNGRHTWELNSPLKPFIESDISPEDKEITQDMLKHWQEKSVPRGEFPCRKIVFTIRSADQGWGGGARQKGTYNGSYTWFDVGLERMIASRDDIIETETEIDTEELPNTSLPGFQFPITCSVRTVLPIAAQTDDSNTPTKFEHPLIPGDYCLQKNRTATRPTKEYVITWSANDSTDPDSPGAEQLMREGRGRATMNGEYVRNLKIGDAVTVWAKARFPGWCNFVYELRVDVYWAV